MPLRQQDPTHKRPDATLEFDMRIGAGDALVEVTAHLVDGCADSLAVMYRGIDITETLLDDALKAIDQHIDKHFHELCWSASNSVANFEDALI